MGEDLGEDLHEALMSGIVLCRAVNVLRPDSIKKFHTAARLTMQRVENISFFLKACTQIFGMRELLLFRSVDLHDNRNIKQVSLALIEFMKINGEVSFPCPCSPVSTHPVVDESNALTI